MATKKSSKKTASGTRGTKKTITKTRTHTSKRKSKSRTHKSKTHPTRSAATRYTTKGTRTRGTTTSRTRTAYARGPSSSIGRGLNDPLLYVFLTILTLSVIVLLAVGIWLLAARNGWPHGLNTAGNVTYTRLISYGTACVIASLLLIFVIVFTLLAAIAKTGAAARINRLIAVFIASVIFIIFLLMIITGIMIASHQPAFVANVIRDGWSKTLLNDRTVGDACHIQRSYGCQGWYDNQCRTCRPTVDGVFDYTVAPGSSCDNTQRAFCPRCFPRVGTVEREAVSAMEVDTGMASVMKRVQSKLSLSSSVRSEVFGCRYFVRRRNRTFFIPFTVYIIFLSLILLFLSWKTCVDSLGRR